MKCISKELFTLQSLKERAHTFSIRNLRPEYKTEAYELFCEISENEPKYSTIREGPARTAGVRKLGELEIHVCTPFCSECLVGYCRGERNVDNAIAQAQPAAAIAIFLIVVFHIFAGVTRQWCNVGLKLLQKILFLVPNGPRNSIPVDVRTILRKLNLISETTTYASCPTCGYCYPPEQRPAGIFFYPRRCTYQSLGRQSGCGATLTKSAVNGGRSVRVPIKPFVVQSLDAFLSRLLSRVDMVETLRKGLINHKLNGDKVTIGDGSVLSRLKGADGLPFLGELDNELRLAFSLSIDWFNPYHNKMAGKKASLGAITLACLNLSPELRYKQENLFLAAVLPGPKETSVSEINFYLAPIVDMLLQAWQIGTQFEFEGRILIVRSIVACLVADLPAARKAGGMAHFSAAKFCGFCTQMKANINSIDYWTWKKRSGQEIREIAENWRDASSMSERKQIFKEFGIRWSELFRLPYWDPAAQTVIDGMHNLFLGVVQHHVRDILGLDDEQRTRNHKEKQGQFQAHESSSDIFVEEQRQRKGYLEPLTISKLKELCRRAHIKGYSKRGITKNELMDMLSRSTDAIFSSFWDEYSNGSTVNPLPLAGPELFDAAESTNRSTALPGLDKLSPSEVKMIRERIRRTSRPRWHAKSPLDLGSSGHGKLKADQWRSLIEFDLPAALAYICFHSSSQAIDIEGSKERFECTMLLAVAVGWAVSRQTSRRHAENYTENMHRYLQSLLNGLPKKKLLPNHHVALHFAPFLEAFGPARGWWAFPFERVIGRLQRINTNYKIGAFGVSRTLEKLL
jgi:hypothetical protein